ncbi:hypothetical protein ACFVW8_21790 [Streptomyces sp. NPDC058221]|uniref:hypothetical protein n=1 Tax=Streptomyces sp. NPDC058221 TaxID=3346388 RepID=UPI0036E537CC
MVRFVETPEGKKRLMPDYPNAMLAHYKGRTVDDNRETVDYFSTIPIDIPRPHTGVTERDVPCPFCEEILKVRVFPAEKVKSLRRRWRTITIGGWLLMVAAAPYCLFEFDRSNEENLWWIAGFFASFVLFGAPAMIAGKSRQQEDGVRVNGPIVAAFQKNHGTIIPDSLPPTTQQLREIIERGKDS